MLRLNPVRYRGSIVLYCIVTIDLFIIDIDCDYNHHHYTYTEDHLLKMSIVNRVATSV